LLAVVPLSLTSTAALAAAPDALDYQAPAGCPDAKSFAAAVEARGASFAGAASSEGARQLLVRIEREGGGFAGSLELRSGTELSEPRQVQGASCAEVSDALAVVTAIALQRDATALPATAVASPAVPAAAVVAPPAVVPPPSVESSGPLEVVMARKDLLVPSGKLVLDHTSAFSLVGGAQLGAIPGVVLPRLDFDITRTNVVKTPGGSAFVLGNQFRVRWTLLGLAEHRAQGYQTSLLGLKAGVGGCTPLSYNPNALILKVCSDFVVGVIDLTTTSPNGGVRREKTQGLATASLEANLQYNLSRLFHLDFRAGGELWLNRISAERDDGSRLFQSPLFNAHVLVGIGLHF
jgi:hypothetical protein